MSKYTLTPSANARSVSDFYLVAVPDEVAADQKAFDGRTFPALATPRFGNYGHGAWRKVRATLRGDLYGLNTSGTGDMVVSL